MFASLFGYHKGIHDEIDYLPNSNISNIVEKCTHLNFPMHIDLWVYAFLYYFSCCVPLLNVVKLE